MITNCLHSKALAPKVPYAPRLQEAKEPEIYKAIRFGTILENVVFDRRTRVVDFNRWVVVGEHLLCDSCFRVFHAQTRLTGLQKCICLPLSI